MTVKSRLLELLEQNKGQVISGEAAAEALFCTRAAIWKAVRSLREDGYQIEAGTNRGYCLVRENFRISEEAILPRLRDMTVRIKVFEEVDSTNREARRELASGDAKEGTVIISRRQMEGRGRRGRSFYSPEGGIYMSVIIRPRTTLQQSLLLTVASASAVYRAVQEVCGIELSIKWVNDLYLEDRKVCGILTEAITDFESGEIEYAVIGIGLNVRPAKVPEELQSIVGFLGEEEQSWDTNQLIAALIRYLYQESENPRVTAIYREHNQIPGHRIRIRDGETERLADALEILEDGTLLVREEDGQEHVLHYGEVSVLSISEREEQKND